MDSLIIRAAEFAREKHKGQFRKFPPDEPYVCHPSRVAGLITLLPYTTLDMIVAAWLHDVLEDTKTSVFEIEQNFGKDVLQIVKGLTNPSQWPVKSPLSRKERKEMDLDWISQQGKYAKIIKLADRLDNVVNLHMFDRQWQHKYGAETHDLIAVIGEVEPEFTNRIVAILDVLNV